MKKPLPYRWLPQGHTEIKRMHPELHGCYRFLWDYCWENDGLPKDMTELAAIAHYSPAGKFEEMIWQRVKDNFYYDKAEGKYRSFELDEQKRKEKKLRKSQSDKGKWKRQKELDIQPTVNREGNNGSTERPQEDVIVNSEEPESNRRLTGNEPEMNREATEMVFGPVEIKPFNRTATEIKPSVSPRLTPGEPADDSIIDEISASDHEIFRDFDEVLSSPEMPENPVTNSSQNHVVINSQQNEMNAPLDERKEAIHETETDLSETPEPDFDQELAWRKIARIYPNQSRTDEAKAFFMQEIASRHLYRRFMKAVTEYRQRVHEPEAKLFYDWFWEWQQWEYPVSMGANNP